MTRSPIGFVTAGLTVAGYIAASVLFSAPALADCASSVSTCIKVTQGKPDNVAKCTEAGQRCQSTGVFVGPYSGTSFNSGKTKSAGCNAYNHSRACY